MMSTDKNHSRAAYAKAVLREVPLAHLHKFIDDIDPGKAVAGIGQGCGVGCLRAHEAQTIDPHGHTGLTHQQLGEVLSDKKALLEELKKHVHEVFPPAK
jgi:hypothetical protein